MSHSGVPLVSVIMPTYNHGRFIAEAIDSVLAQTYTNWELIIVNNYSTDNTDEVLSRYAEPRIRVEEFGNDGIIAKSRNRGISLARGEYIALLDSDDVWDSNKLQQQVGLLERHSDLLACSTALNVFPKGLRSPLLPKRDRRLSLGALKRGNVVYNSSVVMRRACVGLVGTFSEERALSTLEDYEYWLRILQYQDRSIWFIDTPLLGYRVSSSNQSGIWRELDVEAETAKWNRLAEVRFVGRDREQFVRRAQSLIARRCREFGCTSGRPPAGKPRLLFTDRVRMVVSHAAKGLLRSARDRRAL